MPRWLSCLYQWLLPPTVRRRHGAEMATVFGELARDAHARRGAIGLIRACLHELRDLLRLALSDRPLEARTPRLDDRAPAPEPSPRGRAAMLQALLQDVRYAARLLRRSPGFTAVCLATIALAIGANTAIFTVVHGIVLKALPFDDPERVVVLAHRTKGNAGLDSTTPGNLDDWRQRATAFASIAGFAQTERIVVVNGNAERLAGCMSVGSIFDVLGRPAAEGRTLTAADDDPGAEPVVVLSTRLARRLFGTRSALGQSLTINDLPHAVVGVMPSDFAFYDYGDEYWIPARFDSAFRRNRDQYFLLGIARLAPGVDLAAADAQLNTVMDAIRRDYPQFTQNAVAAVAPAKDVLLDGVERRLGMLMGAVALVLLIACANLGNLLLARGTQRRREMAVRHALGAGYARLIRQTIAESVLLSVLGGALGVGLAVVLVRVLTALLPQDLPRLAGVALDGPVLLFAVGTSVAAGLLFGAFPALQLLVRAPMDHLRSGTRGTTREGLARQGLVISQMALALVLLAGAGLLTRSFGALLDVPPGFDTAQLLTFTATVASPAYRERDARARFFERAATELERLPGVRSVTHSTTLPVSGRGNGAWFNMVARPWPPDQTPPGVPNRAVRSNYFRALGVPILKGRGFTPADGREGPPVVIISESVARRFFSDLDPIGQHVFMGTSDNRVVPDSEIVGVVADVKQRGLDEERPEAVYAPQAVVPFVSSVTYAIRTSTPPETLVAAVRDVFRQLDPGVPLVRVQTMDDIVRRSTAPARSSMLLVGLFAAVALVLALVGVFGVLSYTVSQRTAEFGIRMAFGASAGDVRRHVLGRGLRPVAVGIAVGLLGALLLARFMTTLLFGVTATDPATLATVSVVMAATAAAAAYLPARRATRVDPVQVLRQQ